MYDENILIVGGDSRQKLLNEMLRQKGYSSKNENGESSAAFDYLAEASVVIFPVPVTSDGMNIYSCNPDFKLDLMEFLNRISSEQLVFGGMFNEDIKRILKNRNIKYYDFNSFEHFTVYNAFLTAQGALKLLLDNTNSLVTEKKVLITGFGRIGKALANLLKGLNPEVYVAARSENQLTQAECFGFKTTHLKNVSAEIYLFDFIFNTVPDNIFSESDISHINPDCIYFELASKPFGAKKELFESAGKQYVFGGGLPGKFVSYSAAEKIGELVENLI